MPAGASDLSPDRPHLSGTSCASQVLQRPISAGITGEPVIPRNRYRSPPGTHSTSPCSRLA